MKGTSKQTYIDSTQWNTGNLKLGVPMRLNNIMFTNFITNYKHATRYMTGKFSIYIFEILITVDNNMSRNINIKNTKQCFGCYVMLTVKLYTSNSAYYNTYCACTKHGSKAVYQRKDNSKKWLLKKPC